MLDCPLWRRPPTHIIPCSNILASLRSLRNCAWNDMCGRPAPQLHVHTSRYTGYPSKAAKLNSNTSNLSNPMRQRGCLFVASGYLLDKAFRYRIRLLMGNSDWLQAREHSPPLGGPYISSRAQFRSAARMFEHGMIYRGLPGAGGHYDAHFQRRNGLSHTRRTEAAGSSVGFV